MQQYQEYLPTTITFADESPVKETKQHYKSTHTPHLMVKCAHCTTFFRFTHMDSKALWDFRYAHAAECAEFQEAIRDYIDDFGEDEYSRNRVKLIGRAIGGSRVMHKDKPEGLLMQCSPRCHRATGTDCNCLCAGANHGVSYQQEVRANG